MKHLERLVFGVYVIAIVSFFYAMLTWKVIAYIFGFLIICYVIGYVLDRFGIISKLKFTEDNDTQKYDDC